MRALNDGCNVRVLCGKQVLQHPPGCAGCMLLGCGLQYSLCSG